MFDVSLTSFLCIGFIVIFYESKFGLTAPIFLFFFHFFVGTAIRELVLRLSNYQDILAPWVLMNEKTHIMSTAILFYLTYSMVLILRLIPKKTIDYRCGSAEDFYNSSVLFKLSIIYFMVLFLYLLINVFVFGSIESALIIYTSRGVDEIRGLGFLSIMPDVINAVFLFHKVISTKTGLHKRINILMFFITLAIFVFLGARGNLIQFIIMILLLNSLVLKERLFFNKHIAILIICVFSVIYLGYSARIAIQNNMTLNESLSLSSEKIITVLSAPFALQDHFMLATKYADLNGLQYGNSYCNAFLNIIPRSFWSEKPELLGAMVRKQFWGDSLGGIPPGLIGETYIQFGGGFFIIFPIFVSIVLHKFHSIQERIIFNSAFNPTQYILYAVILVYFCFNILRGGIDVGFTRLVLNVFSIYFIAHIIRAKVFNQK